MPNLQEAGAAGSKGAKVACLRAYVLVWETKRTSEPSDDHDHFWL